MNGQFSQRLSKKENKMRNILFRAKNIYANEWVYGYPVFSEGKTKARLYPINIDDSFAYHAINPDTISQYIGLNDKNGCQIFEGDIVKGRFGDIGVITGEIVYGSDATYFINRKGLLGIYLNNAEDWLTVIGNKWDNPELLEAQVIDE